MRTEEVRHGGLRGLRCSVKGLSFVVALDVGPRVLALEPDDGPNLFALLPGETLGEFRFHGGHRLWSAPEVPERTYRPDEDPVDLQIDDATVGVAGRPDRDGIRKVIRLRVLPDGARVVVAHQLRNEGSGVHELAAWALTQAPLGGVATLPLAPPSDDPSRVTPERSIVLWPYTRLAHPALSLADDAVRIATSHVPGTRLKVGVPNRVGWLAYDRAGWRLTKRVAPHEATSTVDLGATLQVYADGRFIELESLGPLRRLAPGDVAEHEELWEVERA